MASSAITQRKRHLAVTGAAVFSAEQVDHAVLLRPLLDADKDIRMAQFAAVPDRMFLMGKNNLRNPFYLKPGGVPLPDAALQKLIARGVKVAACNLAITFYSGMVAKKMGLSHDAVKKDWTEAVFPGIQIVPSGVVAI